MRRGDGHWTRSQTRKGCKGTFSLPSSTYGGARAVVLQVPFGSQGLVPPSSPTLQQDGTEQHPPRAHLGEQELLSRTGMVLTAWQKHLLHPTPLPKVSCRATNIIGSSSEPP